MIYKPHAIGKQAEQQAREFLETKGLRYLQANYHCSHGEIDLIMQDGHMLVFIEVRSRHPSTYGNVLETITPRKQQKIMKTALYFLKENRLLKKPYYRFDVVGIEYKTGRIDVHWIKNAFTRENGYIP